MIGTRLGSWTLERELGRGGMGCVYLARRAVAVDTLPERAAVKVLAAHLTFDAGLLARFQREIEVLRQLDHPNIVRLLEAGAENGRHFYAMEHIEGQSYEALLHQHGRLPWSEVLDMALQVCQALKHAHDRGVIHRDLKPSNLLRGQSPSPPPSPAEGAGGEAHGPVKLTDFGIAWVFAAEHLTTTGAVVGTAEYLSPEQAAGKQPTKRSDLYSLGVVLYTLLTGRTPFEGETVALLHKHRYAQFERPLRLAPEIPPDLDEVICQLLEKEPEKRPADAAVLHKRLDSLRRKYERRAAQNTSPGSPQNETAISAGDHESRTGPATLMAKLMRAELNAQKRGGPIKQFFNHPLVLVALFVLTLGTIVYAFLPTSAERLYARAAARMQSDEPEDWESAIDDLKRLQQKHPDFRKEEVAAFLAKAVAAQESRREVRNARLSGPMSEAHWFFEQALRLRQQGEDEKAKALWRELIRAFDDVPAERPWVDLAQGELDQPSPRERTGDERWASVRKALAHARQLDKDGKRAEADKLRQALRTLYADDPSARTILDKE
jgi:serine/threonine protein kinase